MGPLLEAVRTQNSGAAQEWANSEHWATVEQLIVASSASSSPPPRMHNSSFSSSTSLPSSRSSGSGIGVSSVQETVGWTCNHCTFFNPTDLTTCEMCRLPR